MDVFIFSLTCIVFSGEGGLSLFGTLYLSVSHRKLLFFVVIFHSLPFMSRAILYSISHCLYRNVIRRKNLKLNSFFKQILLSKDMKQENFLIFPKKKTVVLRLFLDKQDTLFIPLFKMIKDHLK